MAVLATRLAPLIARFGVSRLIVAGLASTAAGYALFLPIGLELELRGGDAADLPPDRARVRARLRVAQRRGDERRRLGGAGLAGGLVNTSFQFGGALVLAVATAVNTANAAPGGSASALLDGFHAAIAVSVIAAVLGVAATVLRPRSASVPARA